MPTLLEQAEAARQIARKMRRHIREYNADGILLVIKHADEARAAELEYRLLTLSARKPQITPSSPLFFHHQC